MLFDYLNLKVPVDKAAFIRRHSKAGAAFKAGHLQHFLDMVAHGDGGHAKPPRNLRIGIAAGQLPQHLQLPWRKFRA